MELEELVIKLNLRIEMAVSRYYHIDGDHFRTQPFLLVDDWDPTLVITQLGVDGITIKIISDTPLDLESVRVEVRRVNTARRLGRLKFQASANDPLEYWASIRQIAGMTVRVEFVSVS